MTLQGIRVSSRWLALREPADGAARSIDLVNRLRRQLPATEGRATQIHDLGAGTGAMTRWLAPLLLAPQHWVLVDRDADLLEVAAAEVPAAVTVETRQADITRLGAADVGRADLLTASALLDMLTADELAALVTVGTAAACPMLVTMSVVGRVVMTPAAPLDARLAGAFNAHQRRMTERGRLLGPDAVAIAAESFRRAGAEVLVAPSPWRLGAEQGELAAEWFAGWVGAACEQEAELAAESGAYARRRLAQARAGELAVTVDHADLLILPGRPG